MQVIPRGTFHPLRDSSIFLLLSFFFPFSFSFLVACTRLCSSLWRSVCRSVFTSFFNAFSVLFKRKSELICGTAPTQQHATVQTCTRPCFFPFFPPERPWQKEKGFYMGLPHTISCRDSKMYYERALEMTGLRHYSAKALGFQ